MTLDARPPLETELAAVHHSAMVLSDWISEQINELPLPHVNKLKVPGLLFDLTLEHHAAIVSLVGLQINGSAFALLRSCFESFVRGAWFQCCASNKELEDFIKKDQLKPNFGQMVKAIETHPDFADEILSSIKDTAWTPMNAYTHGGMHQVARRTTGKTIEGTYNQEEIIEVLKAAGTFALLAGLQIARLVKDKNLTDIFTEKLNGKA